MDTVSINYSLNTESKRIAHTIHGISSGFYISNKWYVLSVQKLKKTQSIVFMPNLDYKALINIANPPAGGQNPKNLKDDNSNAFINNKDLILQIEKELQSKNLYKQISKAQFIKLEQNYQKILLPAIKKAKQLMPILQRYNFNITVSPSHYGVYLSFDTINYSLKSNKDIGINITIRIDQDSKYLLEGFASSISRQLVETYGSWRETEAVSDFLTKYVFEFTQFKGTLESINKLDYNLLSKSVDYLIQLGAPTGLPLIFDEKRNLIYYFGENVTPNFSPYEFRVLKALIINRNRTVTIDELSDQIYKNNSDLKFTLWGITKTVQRVRDKLQEIGVPRNLVQNVKGEGFKLLD